MADPNESVFPLPASDFHREYGLTKFEWFAGMALTGIMANPERWKQIANDYNSGKKTYEQCSEANVNKALSLAEEMMRKL